jgi:hypothetical protein
MYQNLGGANNLANPEVSAFDSVPATSGPFCELQQLQVYLGNSPIYQNPIQMSYEAYLQEIQELGANGGHLEGQTSGLLSQTLWEQNHRFYSIDLSRRLKSQDGSSQSIQVSFQNASPNYDMKIITMAFYEKAWSINTGLGQITPAS